MAANLETSGRPPSPVGSPVGSPAGSPAVGVAQEVATPRLGDVLRRVACSLVTAVVVPAILLWTMLVLFDFVTAALVALAWTVGVLGWQRATRRPVSGLLVLTSVVLALRTALSVAAGSAFLYFVQPVFADLIVAGIFLGSYFTARPAIARLAPDFVHLDPVMAAHPRLRSLFRNLTLMWGTVILLKAGVTMWLLESLSTVDFVLIKSGAVLTLTFTAVLVTVVWSVVVARQTGILRPR